MWKPDQIWKSFYWESDGTACAVVNQQNNWMLVDLMIFYVFSKQPSSQLNDYAVPSPCLKISLDWRVARLSGLIHQLDCICCQGSQVLTPPSIFLLMVDWIELWMKNQQVNLELKFERKNLKDYTERDCKRRRMGAPRRRIWYAVCRKAGRQLYSKSLWENGNLTWFKLEIECNGNHNYKEWCREEITNI